MVNVNEKILSCKMKYVVSRENSETDIESKNLSITDQNQTIFFSYL